MKLNDFMRSTLKVAASIFVAVVALAIVGWCVSLVKDSLDRREAKPFEEVKLWPVDLKSNLQVSLLARTKLVDGRMFAEVKVEGFPAYLSDPRLAEKNRAALITLLFQDKDGFKVHSRSIQIREFSAIVDAKGTKSGLSYEFDEYLNLRDYARFENLRVQWTLDTEIPATAKISAQRDSEIADHCAPNLSKAERLKRLATHGTLRQTSDGAYEVGYRSLRFFYDGSLLSCN